MSDIVKGCATCRFSSTIRPNPQVLQSVRICQWGPPVFQLQLTPRGEMMPGFGHVVVPDNAFCHQFQPIANGIANQGSIVES